MDQRDGLAVVFDFDGTLVHFPVGWERLRARLGEKLAAWGEHSPLRPLLPSLRESEARLSARWGEKRAAEVMEEIWETVRREELAATARAQALPGAGEMLAWLEGRDIPYAVVSNSHTDAIYLAFVHLSFPLPRVVIGRDMVNMPKPDPEGVRWALGVMGAEPCHSFMVGDSSYDIEAGLALGMKVVAVDSAGVPDRYPGVHIIESLAGLIGLLEKDLVGVEPVWA